MMISLQDVIKAKRAITPYIHHTPLVHSTTFSKICGAKFYMKCENLQKTGAFKARGGVNSVLNLDEKQREKGVVTASSGNHAQGVAYAAQLFQTACVLCMQDWSSPAKIAACRGYGAEIKLIDGDSQDTIAEANRLKNKYGYEFVHPFNSNFTVAGQGTIGLEILQDLPDVDVVVVPIAGGGLASGVAVALKEINPKIRIYGVQPEKSAAMKMSLEAGRVVEIDRCDTCCDGLTAKTVGQGTFEIVKHYLDDVITVSEIEIKEAVIRTLQYMKMMIEPSSATAVAAILNKKIPICGNVVAVATGGNCSMQLLSELIDETQND